VYVCACVRVRVYSQDCGFIGSDVEEEITVAAANGNDLYVCVCFRQYVVS